MRATLTRTLMTSAAAAALVLPATAAAPTADAVTTHSATARSAWPWMSLALPHTVHGHTLTYRYADAGYQYLVTADGKSYNNRESAGYQITFGDHSLPDGGNGLGDASCTTRRPVAAFRDITSIPLTHHYTRPGRYTITVTGYYCGLPHHTSITRQYTITIR